MAKRGEPAYTALPRPDSGHIRSVQALRAVAAMFVVGFHSTILWHDKFAPDIVPWANGNAGVDLFFVISGFIMVVSSRRLIGQPSAWRRFLALRIVRIVPLYWLVTAAKLALIVAVPAMALHSRPTTWNAVASFLFLPSRDTMGAIRPIIDVGWTLSFEMLFYLAFASALFFLVEPLFVVGPAMAFLAAVSLAHTADWPAITAVADPITLEFVFGVLIGRAFLSGWLQRRSSQWMILLCVAGVLCLAFAPIDGGWDRIAIRGLAATVALTAAVLAERWLDKLLPRQLVWIGEASYSLYLTHGFVLPVVGLVLARSGLSGNNLGTTLIAVCLIASTFASLLVYRFVELPITNALRALVRRPGWPGATGRQASV